MGNWYLIHVARILNLPNCICFNNKIICLFAGVKIVFQLIILNPIIICKLHLFESHILKKTAILLKKLLNLIDRIAYITRKGPPFSHQIWL